MTRPNILFIHSDQHRWDAVGANGNTDIRTPNLDALAASGANFDHYFVQAPVCMPSRMSYLTGQYPSRTGIMNNGPALPENAVTLPAVLGENGYFCANIGKLHFLPHSRRDHREKHPSYGFDHLEVSDEPGCYEDVYRNWVRETAPDQLDHISLGLPPAAKAWRDRMGIVETIRHASRVETRPVAFPGRSDVTHSAFVAERTMAFLREHHRQQFFCVAGFFSPHAPLVSPQECLDLYEPSKLQLPAFPEDLDRSSAAPEYRDDGLRLARQGYYACVSEVDHHVGRILACLEELGLADRTIVVYTSDHGEWLGEHMQYGKGFPAHDCISRVPCMIRYSPAGLANGLRISDMVEAVDLMPTLLSLADVPGPNHLQGRQLPIPGSKTELRHSALTEGPGWKSLRTDKFRYVLGKDGTESLYDLRVPLGDYNDLAEDPRFGSELAMLRKTLIDRMVQAEVQLPADASY